MIEIFEGAALTRFPDELVARGLDCDDHPGAEEKVRAARNHGVTLAGTSELFALSFITQSNRTFLIFPWHREFCHVL